MSDPLITMLLQFGAAGLIGAMWLAERRQASVRERQLSEAHDRLMAQERELAALFKVVQDNTRAITAMQEMCRQIAARVAAERAHEKRPRSV